jgi:predicted acetyltransferase
MIKYPAKPTAHIELLAATAEQAPILANLLELYAHDFSAFLDIDLGADGRFGYQSLPLYWSEPGRRAFLVKADGKLAGFVLVKRGSEVSGDQNVWDMAEFFVIRGYRRRGIGTQVAHEVWSRLRGRWEVRVVQSNTSAYDFWARVIATFAGEPISPVWVEKNGERWALFSYESKLVT